MDGITTSAIVEINQTASRFQSSIVMRVDNRFIDVKSMLGLCSTLPYNQTYKLEIYGPDEDEAKKAMAAVLDKHGLSTELT
ncbi:HPr family phosphocarrier protein [Gorillibacterium sp. sgz5001074]|uniref:HPr family phosphocarrier protein n=1 Tax=Gorillibacterium sp. sgz5001074 TaxID=3446695 RepID=UPI003F6747CF